METQKFGLIEEDLIGSFKIVGGEECIQCLHGDNNALEEQLIPFVDKV